MNPQSPTLRRVPQPPPLINRELPALGSVRTLADAAGLMARITHACQARVHGRNDVIELIVTAMFADGHVLLEDHPGSGKTTLAKALGSTISRDGLVEGEDAFAAFRRIQFTPDLMPSDVTGLTIFEPEARSFVFRRGPIFANVVLADEINRTSPKVQASLLEAMAEKQVTVDNHTHALEDLFFVIATQNPHDTVGTFPLPKAQLDRFLFKVRMKYLARDAELQVLDNWKNLLTPAGSLGLAPELILQARQVIRDNVEVAAPIREALCDFAQTTRRDRRVSLGISTRSLVLAMSALQVWATLKNRTYVNPQDLADLAVPLFSHRIDLAPGTKDADAVIQESIRPTIEALMKRL